MAKDTLSIGIAVDSSAAVKGFREVDREAAKMAKKLQATQTKLKDGIGKAGLAVAAGAAFMLKGAITAAQESQRVSKVTESVVKSTGGAANLSAKQVGDLATNLSNLTGIDDELIQSSENVLLTFTKVRNEVGKGNDIFSQAAGLALDMSTVLGGDASSAAMQLGKALNDPIKGITALSRSGVSFTAQQKEQVKALVATGDVLGAQKIILKEVATEFGGAAEKAGTDANRAKVAFGNLQESIGGAFLPTIEAAAKAATILADAVGALPKPVQAGAGALAIVGGSALYLTPKIKAASESLKVLTGGAPLASAAMKGLSSAFDTAAVAAYGASGSIGLILGGASVAAAGVGALYLAYQSDATRAAKSAQDFEREVVALNLAMKLNGGTVQDNRQAWLRTEYARHGKEVDLLGLSFGELDNVVSGSHASWEKWRIDQERSAVRSGANKAQILRAVDAVENMRSAYVKVRKASEGATDATKKDTDATKASNDAYKKWRDGVQGAMDAFTKFTDKKAAALDANVAFEQAIDDETQSLKENGTSLDIHTEKGRANVKAAQAARQAIRDQAQALIDNGGSAKDAAALIRDHTAKLNAQERAAGLSADKVKVLNAIVGQTERDVQINWRTPGLSAALAQAQALGLQIGNLIANPKIIQFGVSYASAGGVGSVERVLGKDINGNGVVGRASGGMTWGGLTRVGERGPELVRLPKGSQVYSNRKSRELVGAGAGAPIVIRNVIELDGKVVGESTRTYAQDRQGVTGKAWPS